MAFTLDRVNAVTWLYLGRQSIRQPRLSELSGSGSDRRLTGLSSARLNLTGTGSRLLNSSFVMAQDQAVADLTSRAVQALVQVAAVDLPAGESIGLARSARSTARSYFTGQAESRASQTSYLLRVPNLAQAQVNGSRVLTAAGESDIAAGDYQVKLTVDDRDPVYLDLSVAYTGREADDNRAILERLGRSIEAASQYLTAEVVEGTTLDDNELSVATVKLVVSTRQAGQELGFKLADESGDLVETLALAGADWAGQDLVYVQGSQRATPYQSLSAGFYRQETAGQLTPRLDYTAPLSNLQLSLSRTLDPDGASDLPAGRYRFKVSLGQESSEVTFGVDYSGVFAQRNESILKRLALEIERAQPGLKARVFVGEASDEDDQIASGATLLLTNRSNDQDQSFRLQDVEGDLLARLDLNRTSRPAEPAQAAPAGRGDSRPSDVIGLDETRLLGQVHQVFGQLEGLLVEPAREPVIDQVEAVASAHNNFLEGQVAAEAYVKPLVGLALAQELGLNRLDYAQVGIDVSSSGRLSIGEGLGESLDRDLALVRQRLNGQSGLLTVIERHLAQALALGFDQYRVRRPDRVYDSAFQTEPGFDPYARINLTRLGSSSAFSNFRGRGGSLSFLV